MLNRNKVNPVLSIMMKKCNHAVIEVVFNVVFFLQDYWFSLVFKRLVGPRVLAVRVAGLQRKPQPGRVIRDKLRIYAHCTSYYKYVLQSDHLRLVYNQLLILARALLSYYCVFTFFLFH